MPCVQLVFCSIKFIKLGYSHGVTPNPKVTPKSYTKSYTFSLLSSLVFVCYINLYIAFHCSLLSGSDGGGKFAIVTILLDHDEFVIVGNRDRS